MSTSWKLSWKLCRKCYQNITENREVSFHFTAEGTEREGQRQTDRQINADFLYGKSKREKVCILFPKLWQYCIVSLLKMCRKQQRREIEREEEDVRQESRKLSGEMESDRAVIPHIVAKLSKGYNIHVVHLGY